MNKAFSFLIIILLAFCTHISAQTEIEKWKFSNIHEYTWRSFASSSWAKMRIDYQNIDSDLLSAAIFFATNEQREKFEMPIFLPSEALNYTAYGHAYDMVKLGFFSHTSLVKGKETLTDRIKVVGIEYGAWGENIAENFGIEYYSGASVYPPDEKYPYLRFTYTGDPIPNHTYGSLARVLLVQWMNSPGHRKNILSPNFVYLGTGGVHYKDEAFFNIYKVIAVQNFSKEDGTLSE